LLAPKVSNTDALLAAATHSNPLMESSISFLDDVSDGGMILTKSPSTLMNFNQTLYQSKNLIKQV
jgi:hypothetical protein